MQVIETPSLYGITVELRLDLDIDKVVYVIYYRSDNEPRLLEGDIITAYGVLDGLITYESIFGEPITIPLFNMFEYDIYT